MRNCSIKPEILSPIREELRNQAERPAGNDERIAAFCIASLEVLGDNRHFHDVMADFHEARSLRPTHAVNLVLRSLQKQLLLHEPEEYPRQFTSTDEWRRVIRDISDPGSSPHEDFMQDLMNRDVQSNVSERYKAVALTALLMRDRVGQQPSILDVGCSRNHGLKKLALGKRFPFQSVKAEQLLLDDQGTPSGTKPDTEATQLIKNVLDRSSEIAKSVGIDKIDIDDEANRIWARSCSFYPSELLDDNRMEEYDILDEINGENVQFYHGDITDIDPEDLEAKTSCKKFDMVTFSTILYQLQPRERVVAIDQATRLLKPDGVILIQDFVGVNQDDPTKLEFYDNWFKTPYIYRTIMIDPKIADNVLLELFRWDNGRCKSMLTGEQIGRVASYDLRTLSAYSALTANHYLHKEA